MNTCHNYSVSVKVVEVLGKQKAIDIFRETRKTEEDGGMMILVCSLNIFFFLL
jgi:cyclopropane fatty-acyl-phospholipid synthase-like methyltransferase